MVNILPAKKDELKRDMALVKKIKPKLQKYLIDTQVKSAQQTAIKQKEETDAILSAKEIYNRALTLSYIAWDKLKLWKDNPPYMRARWTTALVDSPEMQQDRVADITGLQLYLIRMYRHYITNTDPRQAVPNPLKEENLLFYWKSMRVALALEQRVDQSLVDKGNVGLGIVEPKKPQSGIQL